MNTILLPFTASQWQELEHQALIFKYIITGIPVPSDLLFSLHTTSLSYNFLLSPHSQHAACFQMGKKIDPEPGRCRRTDGKKWRCAKEAYPDSKYCERHIHRGKGRRSRKHVEQLLNYTPSPKTTTTPQSHNPNPSGSSYNNFLDTQHFRRNRNPYNGKDGVDEHSFFCEPSGTTRRSFSAASSMDNSWSLGTNSSSKQQREYSWLELQSQSHLFHGVPLVKNERGNHEPNKTTHRFFDEEPIRSSRDWDSSSTTRLSISIPSSSSNHYFPQFNSTRKLDG